MAEETDELGPVDYVVVEFPQGSENFSGEMAQELVNLVESGTIRLLDLLILSKDEDGSFEAFEVLLDPDLRIHDPTMVVRVEARCITPTV